MFVQLTVSQSPVYVPATTVVGATYLQDKEADRAVVRPILHLGQEPGFGLVIDETPDQVLQQVRTLLPAAPVVEFPDAGVGDFLWFRADYARWIQPQAGNGETAADGTAVLLGPAAGIWVAQPVGVVVTEPIERVIQDLTDALNPSIH